MWICANDGFVSAVEDRSDPDRLVVRARRRKELEALLPGREIVANAGTDYRYRTTVTKEEFAEVVAARIRGIGYGNFKGSVKDRDLHDLYMDFWSLHMDHQRRERTPARD